MAQEIINTGETANDGSGEPLRQAFDAVNNNFTEIYSAGPVGSNIVITGNTITVTGINNNLVLAANGIGNVQSNSAIMPAINAAYDIGSAGTQFDTVYAQYFVGNGSLLTGITASGGSSIANGASNVNIATANGNITMSVQTQSNVMVVGRFETSVRGNLLPATDDTYNLGNAAQRWNDLYLSGNTLYLNTATIQANATAMIFTNPVGGQFVLQGSGLANTSSISNGLTQVGIATANGNRCRLSCQRATAAAATATSPTAASRRGQRSGAAGGVKSAMERTFSEGLQQRRHHSRGAGGQQGGGSRVLCCSNTRGSTTSTLKSRRECGGCRTRLWCCPAGIRSRCRREEGHRIHRTTRQGGGHRTRIERLTPTGPPRSCSIR